jgi:flagellar basal-body rod protein FlgG
MDPLKTAASGMQAQQTRIEVISNNLANVNTTAFKRSRAQFEDLLYQTEMDTQLIDGQDTSTIGAVQVGRGTRLAGVQRNDAQGALELTGRTTDLAIEGTGYFQVSLPDGRIGFTRDGNFSISDQGVMVTNQGYTVLPGIDIPPDAVSVTVSRQGSISVTTAGDANPVEVGRMELARFNNPNGLQAMGENLYINTPAAGEPIIGFPGEDGLGRVVQGALESSNVELVQEMVDMITAMRAYEINSKAVQTADEMQQISNNLVR